MSTRLTPVKKRRFSSTSKKLITKVVHFTSEDSNYPITSLTNATLADDATLTGWRTAKKCSYPQTLVFKIENDGDHKLTEIQLLKHDTMVATTIDIHLGVGSAYESCDTVLGTLTFEAPEKYVEGVEQVIQRELRQVHLNHVAKFIKLIINGSHPHELNTDGQVGIIALSVVGQKEILHQISSDAKSKTPTSASTKGTGRASIMDVGNVSSRSSIAINSDGWNTDRRPSDFSSSGTARAISSVAKLTDRPSVDEVPTLAGGRAIKPVESRQYDSKLYDANLGPSAAKNLREMYALKLKAVEEEGLVYDI